MEGDKLTLKRAEISVQRFNEVAIPHHLGLLKNHKSNIEKCLAIGDWEKIRKEEINATRVVKEIKNLLREMDELRDKLSHEDTRRFDALYSSGREKALNGIKDYMSIELRKASQKKIEPDSECDEEQSEVQSQMQLEAQKQDLLLQQACLEEYERLERDIADLHEMFRGCSAMIEEQGETVNLISDYADEAVENTIRGEQNLRQALRYKKAMYPVMGAFFGTCLGGPIGLVAGMKAGVLAAAGCGVLGFTGGSVLKKIGVYSTTVEGVKEE